MRSILRACDFSRIPDFASSARGTASAVIHDSGGAVTADIHFVEPGEPGAHFDVDLIQVPRPANAPCDGPGPGVAVGALNTDGVGVAQHHRAGQPPLRHDRVWVFIRQPSARSQSPAEFYTSDFPAKVERLDRRQAVLALDRE